MAMWQTIVNSLRERPSVKSSVPPHDRNGGVLYEKFYHIHNGEKLR